MNFAGCKANEALEGTNRGLGRGGLATRFLRAANKLWYISQSTGRLSASGAICCRSERTILHGYALSSVAEGRFRLSLIGASW